MDGGIGTKYGTAHKPGKVKVNNLFPVSFVVNSPRAIFLSWPTRTPGNRLAFSIAALLVDPRQKSFVGVHFECYSSRAEWLRSAPPPRISAEQPTGNRNTSSQKGIRDRPDAAETCRELHQLIRETVGLVEVLTRQATELEGQGWNRPPGGSQPARRGKSRTRRSEEL